MRRRNVHSVTTNDVGKDTTGSVDTESEGADVDENLVSALLSEKNTTLESSTQTGDLVGLILLKMSLRRGWTLDIRVEPPTRTTSSMSSFFVLASFNTCSMGFRVLRKAWLSG